MRALLAACLILISVVASARSQTAPFDMSPERPAGAVPAAPRLTFPPAQTPPAQPPSAPPAPAPPAVARPVSPTPKAANLRRYIVPFSQLGLHGESDERTWSVYLTPEQAAAPAKFNFAYQNAVVVAPEISKLSVHVNDRVIGEKQISSPNGPSSVSFDIPPGLLQPGSNLVTFEASQYHRTDCSIESTYELWSEIDPKQTYLSFAGADAAKLSSTDAVRAIGVNETGRTEFDFVVPALEQPGTTKPLMRLAQGLAILGGMPNQSFAFSTSPPPQPAPGRLTVMVGTASELQSIFPALPAAVQTGPLATFVTDGKTGAPILLISGPSWQMVEAAIDSIVSPADRSLAVRRDVIVTQKWRVPDAPLLFSDKRLTFSQLGVRTTEFSGRRFRREFNIAVPADFYANAYGEATILLDAAYADAVLPGSHIDVYVNGNIATTVPITSSGGGIFRHLPIRLTMRHFRPGINSIVIEAGLLTREDQLCVPGSTRSATPRFAIFDTSEFHMPDFARIGQRPNLAATTGTGYPYSRSTEPIPLYIDRVDADTLSATATLLGQLAIMAGHPLPIDIVASPAAIGDRNAIFIGSISQMPPTALSQLNIAAASQASWRAPEQGQLSNPDTSAAFEEWRSKVRGGSWRGQISAFQDWMRRNFDISLSSLQFVPSIEETFTPSNADTLMIAQGTSPDGGGTWTIVTAPMAKDLRQGINTLTEQENWPQIVGHITTYAAATGKVEIVPVTRFDFDPTVAPSFSNYRLIVANWLSTNVLSYALLLVILAVLLGLATSGMLSNLGRRR
ncbi:MULTISPECIES: cellulose biosynthesis cyclic di-GMP-binding regulatory protein BcsB [unclassified Sinorhizobium]|uniref:cellulose biosynthesis cyclic di-GMP-binding regulatory protein BcsB n=1 Tax=unclassified Sinorhizobium TaxID=2613772 RepID=UPI0035241C3A